MYNWRNGYPKKMEMKHTAYNIATKEVICYSTSNALRYGVRRRSQINHADGIKNNWVFSHNGVDGLAPKIKKAQEN